METLLDTQRRLKSLLLMYLLVVNAAGDCPKPEGGNNTVLTNESLLKNVFPENIMVTLECSSGYIKESGSEFITCINDQWTESELICKKKDCGQPPPKPHMKFDTSEGTLFGALVKVTCEKGYQISGSSYKECYDQGWSGRAYCEIVTCDKPAIPNGNTSWDSGDDPEYSNTIRYTCHEGYTLIGSDTVVCDETGEYSPDQPVCNEVTRAPATTSRPQDSSAAPTVHRTQTVTTSSIPNLSTLPKVFRGKATSAGILSTTSSSFQGMHDGNVNTATDSGTVAAVVIGAVVLLGVIIGFFLLHKFNMRRKGSYDTREDQKPGLLHFQNL
ncbi:complement decay-accelerating factor isoform X4 [Haplochromis burtoni]|uniref:complement decay-accelerating factor isoform X4 n=1 Tax=Haplochromis burtoni TaxID=8153 RepID=UPI0006C983C0|nr:complement decay-accelerating factor isoform X4 [Haplochromis burtoni]